MKFLLTWVLATTLHAAFVPDFKLKPDAYTVLMAVDAKLADGLTPFQAGAHGKFFIQGWQRPDQQAEWQVTVAESADFAVNILLRVTSGQALRLEVTTDGNTVTAIWPAEARNWQRIAFGKPIPLGVGAHRITLRLTPIGGDGKFDAQVHSLEFIRPAVREELHRRALSLRADTAWFQQARYGMMVHWTSQSMPLKGDPKPYQQAVADFDVETFAEQMKSTGAGFVVFATSHACQYFPAPLAALDRILPGRTCRRDLVADLAAALAKRGMKLILYFHLGANDDAEWLKASGFWETDTSRFFGSWQSLISEVGARYREQLAGWWFDDGSTNYYYRSAPWEQLTRAAKTGFPQRLVGYNAWELNNPTEFHDFFTGEGFQDPRGFNELLTPAGNGRYPSGTHQGLQASACLVTEATWVHTRRDSAPAGPRWNSEQLSGLLTGFIAHRNVPIFNLEITQDGKLSPASLELFKAAAAALPSHR